jgi:hypothetical protein
VGRRAGIKEKQLILATVFARRYVGAIAAVQLTMEKLIVPKIGQLVYEARK